MREDGDMATRLVDERDRRSQRVSATQSVRESRRGSATQGVSDKRRGSATRRMEETQATAPWTYLSNHAHVLVCLSRNPEIRVRDIADQVGITERCVSRILAELEEVRVIEKRRVGRRNHYTMHLDAPLRHPLESHARVQDLIQLLSPR